VSSLALLVPLLALFAGPQETPGTVVVGSKSFPESRVLAEVMALLLEEHTDLVVERRTNLGGTAICHGALVNGEIDLYAEYTGTAWAVVLGRSEKVTDPLRVFLDVRRAYRERFELAWLDPFGFENTYRIATTRERAAELGLATLSDAARHPGLVAGFSLEFLEREDGAPGLAAHYGLELDARGMEHALAYQALLAGEVDLVDAYSTDGKLLRYDLAVLADDRAFFPPYHAAPVVRAELLAEHPEVAEVLARLAFTLSVDDMVALNHSVEVEGVGFRAAAHGLLLERGLVGEAQSTLADGTARGDVSFLAFFIARRGETLHLLAEHVGLTLLSVLLAALVAIPLGVLCARRPHLERLALGFAGWAQTIPSLALLAFLIAVPGLGLSWRSAVFALFLYALLPILRNTVTGLGEAPPDVVDAARGIGLTKHQILVRVRLPLAVRTILAGVRTATVISVGVATLAAFIGAGGLGEPIITGLTLNDTRLILAGALPAALLALVADALLGVLERRLTPRGLRVRGAEDRT